MSFSNQERESERSHQGRYQQAHEALPLESAFIPASLDTLEELLDRRCCLSLGRIHQIVPEVPTSSPYQRALQHTSQYVAPPPDSQYYLSHHSAH